VARGYFERAINEFADLANVEPAERSQIMRGVAELDLDEGKLDEAVRYAEQAVQTLYAAPPNSLDRIEPWRVLARAQIARGDGTAATATLEHALDVAHQVLGEQSNKVANVENDLAVALNTQGRYREAIAHLEKSIAITAKLRPDEPAATAFATINLGSLYESLGDYAKAETLMREGIATLEAETPDESQLDAFRGNLARTLMFRGDIAAARALIERALAGIAARAGDSSFDYAFQLYRLARIELAAGDLDAAAQTLRDCERIFDPMLPAQHALRTQFKVIRGLLAKARGDLSTAQHELESAEAMQAALNGSDPTIAASIGVRIAGVLLARGEVAAARTRLDAAAPVLEAALLPQAAERVEADQIRMELERATSAH